MTITPFEAYKEYLALKLHFSPDIDYDYFKYQGHVNPKIETFLARKDRFQFDRLSKRPEHFDLLVACLCENPKMWIGEIVTNKGQKLYQQMIARREALTYNYKQDLKQLDPDFDRNFTYVGDDTSGVPLLLWKFVRQEINIETMIILDRLVNYLQKWNKKYSNDKEVGLIYTPTITKIKKYYGFVEVDKQKFKKITYNFFADRVDI